MIALAADVSALQNEIAPGMTSFLYRMGGRYRRASRALGSLLKTPLPREADRRVALIDFARQGAPPCWGVGSGIGTRRLYSRRRVARRKNEFRPAAGECGMDVGA